MIKFYGDYEVYSESGVDLTLLRENLKYPAEERLLDNCASLRSLSGEPVFAKNFRGIPMIDVGHVLRLLADHRVEYVLIGGLAMRAHGSAYITEDLDICYNRTPANAAALAASLAPLHPYMRGAPEGLPFRFDQATILAGLNFTLTTDAGDVDVLGEVRGVGFYEAVQARSIAKEMFGFQVWVLNIDGLIASKKAAGRVKDQLHVLELEELKKMQGNSSEEAT
jgi:hypothetical protein